MVVILFVVSLVCAIVFLVSVVIVSSISTTTGSRAHVVVASTFVGYMLRGGIISTSSTIAITSVFMSLLKPLLWLIPTIRFVMMWWCLLSIVEIVFKLSRFVVVTLLWVVAIWFF